MQYLAYRQHCTERLIDATALWCGFSEHAER
jgi:hypothetical protein